MNPNDEVPQPIIHSDYVTDAQFVGEHKRSFSPTNILKMGAVALMVLIIPVSFIAVKNSTDSRSQASEMVLTPPTPIHTTVPTITCSPRPACLDAKPRCYLPEPAEGWCKPSPTNVSPTEMIKKEAPGIKKTQ